MLHPRASEVAASRAPHAAGPLSVESDPARSEQRSHAL